VAINSLLPFEILDGPCYLAQFEMIRESAECYTHGARVASPLLGRRDVFVKYYVDLGKPNRGLVNEAIGYLLAKASDLPVASDAFIVHVPGQRLLEAHPKLEKIICTTDLYPCWATSAVEGAVSKRNQRQVIEALKRWDFCPRMLAFDDWVMNADRTTENVVSSGKKQITLIDHGHIGGSLNWMPDLLASDASIAAQIHRLLWPNGLPKEISNHIVEEARRHEQIFASVRSRVRSVLDLLIEEPDAASAFEAFLQQRANGGYERAKKNHGVLV
jgi:hypothetical protein